MVRKGASHQETEDSENWTLAARQWSKLLTPGRIQARAQDFRSWWEGARLQSPILSEGRLGGVSSSLEEALPGLKRVLVSLQELPSPQDC